MADRGGLKMKTKRVLALLLSAVMLTATACGQGGEEDTKEEKNSASSTNEGEDSADEISGHLTIWNQGAPFEPAMAAIEEAFEEKYPEVDVEVEMKDGNTYYSLLATALQSGDAPDLFWTNGTATTNMEDYVKNDMLMDLSDLDLSFITPESMEMATIDDKVYSVPWMTMETRACFYNKDMFKEKGWEIPKTFSEFEELLGKQKKEGVIPISVALTSFENILFTFEPILSAMDPAYTKGLEDYSVKLTDEPARDALKKMQEWAADGYFGENYAGVKDNPSARLTFTMGEAAMHIAGSWTISSIESNEPAFEYGAFQIPAEDGTTGMIGTCANGFSVYSETKCPEAAKAFAQFCASKEAQTIWIQTLGSVSGNPEIESSNPIANEISDCDNVYTSWQSVINKHSIEGGEGNALVTEYFPKLFIGDMTVDEVMDELAEEME